MDTRSRFLKRVLANNADISALQAVLDISCAVTLILVLMGLSLSQFQAMTMKSRKSGFDFEISMARMNAAVEYAETGAWPETVSVSTEAHQDNGIYFKGARFYQGSIAMDVETQNGNIYHETWHLKASGEPEPLLSWACGYKADSVQQSEHIPNTNIPRSLISMNCK